MVSPCPSSPCSRRGDSLSLATLCQGKPSPNLGRSPVLRGGHSESRFDREPWEGSRCGRKVESQGQKNKREPRCWCTRKEGRGEANRCVSRGEGQLASLPPGSSGMAGGDSTRPSLLLGGWGSSFEFSRLLRRRGDPEGFVTAALGSGRAGV